MTIDDCIKFSLDIKDPEIKFSGFSYKFIQNGVKVKVYGAELRVKNLICNHCQSTNVIKNGHYYSQIKYLSSSDKLPVYIHLAKQRIFCKDCHKTTMGTSEIVDKSCFIANRVKENVLREIQDDRTQKSIARDERISPSTVNRILDEHPFKFNSRAVLPLNLSFDEIKLGKTGYHFIVINNDTSEILKILPDRKKKTILNYFLGFDLSQRQAVKTVSLDLNSYYQDIIRLVFPNAKPIIDRFHIISMFTKSFNQIRASKLRQFDKVDRSYRLLKYEWKLLLMPQRKLNGTNEFYDRHLKSKVTQSERVSLALDISSILGFSYDVMQDVMQAMKDREVDEFRSAITLTQTIGGPMNIVINTIRKNLRAVENAITSPYSNGRIEGINRMIKELQRSAYGYRNLEHLYTKIRLHQMLRLTEKGSEAANF